MALWYGSLTERDQRVLGAAGCVAELNAKYADVLGVDSARTYVESQPNGLFLADVPASLIVLRSSRSTEHRVLRVLTTSRPG